MLLSEERERISQACRRLGPDGLAVGTAGNLSLRADDLVAITPSGHPYDELRPELVCVVRYVDGGQVDGPLKPASELDLHLAALRATGLAAVVHTHSAAATAVASLEGVTALPAVHYYLALFGGTDVRVAEYACYGTTGLAENVRRALRDRRAALMSNHGAVVAGRTLDEAYLLAIQLEWLCDVYLRARSAGRPRVLDEHQMAAAAERLATYGQQVPQQLPRDTPAG